MSIVLQGLSKRYEDHPVVNNVSLEVGDGEFFVLLGPSGSGKTTILSLIAGLTPVDGGRVLLHGRDVTYLPTQQRRIGFVFQNYALFQYMNVADNIEFGLRIRKMPAADRRRRRDELLELVGLAGLGERMPRQLSGGQQQRVALARALAFKPDVLLLDEPLGALDAKIRVELRRNLKAIQRRLGVTSILVTHDQEEAFDLADRVGVMNFGRLLEMGTPEELYQRPQTEFVASFLGTANLLLGSTHAGGVQLGPLYFPIQREIQAQGDPRVQVLFRPEDIDLAPEAEELNCSQLGRAEVEEISFVGSFERLRLRLPPIPGVRPISPPVPFGNRSILVEATRSPEQVKRYPLQPGAMAWVGVHNIHTLTHPGLNFLVLSDGSLRAQAAISLGGKIARLAHARVTLVGYGADEQDLQVHLQEARKELGSGLAALEVLTFSGPTDQAIFRAIERNLYDLVVFGFNYGEDLDVAEEILHWGEHHLLLVPSPQPAAPVSALICAATGEPGKEDVLFAGRLVRHLGADATLLSVLPASGGDPDLRKRTERFLEGGIQSLSLMGVPARATVRTGAAAEEILHEMKECSCDLLVMGSPLMKEPDRISLTGVVGQVLDQVTDRPILIVRSRYLGARIYRLPAGEPEAILPESYR